jgi:predicted AAA+ superfamily ATPase
MNQHDHLAGSLPQELAEDIWRLNPHWEGKPGPRVPVFHRWVFNRLHRLVTAGLTPAVALRGPRRVGKTVLLRQLMERLLQTGVEPQRILYVPFDDVENLRGLRDPILAMAHWFESHVLGQTFNESARAGRIAYIFLDEMQNLDAWAAQVKHLVDNHEVRVLATGSSSLRTEAGRDSLAGRITTIDLSPLLLREIAGLQFGVAATSFWENNGLDALTSLDFWWQARERSQQEAAIRHQAFRAFSQRGAYPVAHERARRVLKNPTGFMRYWRIHATCATMCAILLITHISREK